MPKRKSDKNTFYKKARNKIEPQYPLLLINPLDVSLDFSDHNAIATRLRDHPDSLPFIIDSLFKNKNFQEIIEYINFFIIENLHNVVTSKKENLVLFLTKYLFMLSSLEKRYYVYPMCISAIKILIKAPGTNINQQDTDGYSTLYYVILNSFYIHETIQKELIILLRNHGAHIAPIEQALLDFFANPNHNPKQEKYTELWVSIVREMIFNQEPLGYSYHSGIKQLAIEMLSHCYLNNEPLLLDVFIKRRDYDATKALLKRSIPLLEGTLIQLEGSWSAKSQEDQNILKLLLKKQAIHLVNPNSSLNATAFKMLLQAKDNLFAESILQQQLSGSYADKARQDIFQKAMDIKTCFLFTLINQKANKLFIFFINHFIEHCNFSFVQGPYLCLSQHLFNMALRACNVPILGFLKTLQPAFNINQSIQDKGKGKGKSVLFLATTEQNADDINGLLAMDAQFSETESMDIKHVRNYLVSSCDGSSDEHLPKAIAILTFYDDWRKHKKQALTQAIHAGHQLLAAPLVNIVAEYLLPLEPSLPSQEEAIKQTTKKLSLAHLADNLV